MKNLNNKINSNASLFNNFQVFEIKKTEQKAVKGGEDIIVVDTVDF